MLHVMEFVIGLALIVLKDYVKHLLKKNYVQEIIKMVHVFGLMDYVLV